MLYQKNIGGKKSVHKNLLFGSDYPVPAIRPLLSMSLMRMKRLELLGDKPEQFIDSIFELYEHNPLLANFVILRRASFKGKRLDADIFYKNFINLFTKEELPVFLRQYEVKD